MIQLDKVNTIKKDSKNILFMPILKNYAGSCVDANDKMFLEPWMANCSRSGGWRKAGSTLTGS